MPTARTALSTSVVKDKIYAVGGAAVIQGAGLSTVEEYDPATDQWIKRLDMPSGRAFLSGDTVAGKIYAIGGSAVDLAPVVPTVEEYDIEFKEQAVEATGKLTTLWGIIRVGLNI